MAGECKVDMDAIFMHSILKTVKNCHWFRGFKVLYCSGMASGCIGKMNDQNLFILDGSKEWWNSEENDDIQIISGKRIEEVVSDLSQMSMIQSALDIFPSYGQVYFGAVNSFGAFSTYGRDDIENNSRLKDMIHKDAIYDDDFDSKENVEMNDNAKMIYDVIEDYNKAFPDSYRNLSVVFVNPSELQPIIAAIYKYIDVVRKKNPDKQMNINIKIW